MRAESEYHRYGTLACPAAYDARHARVFGRCEPSTGIKPFTALVDQVMRGEPYASAKRSSGSWTTEPRAATGQRQPASATPAQRQMIHLPVHASWLSQAEVYFSVIKRKLLTSEDVGDLEELDARILPFDQHDNTAARPFDWRFTRTDLDQLLARIRQHDRHAPHPLAA
jgi:hypothetical protein